MGKTTETVTKCEKCQGTGEYRYISRKNGKPASGQCYQCQGKGHMTVADDKRTMAYWMYRACEG